MIETSLVRERSMPLGVKRADLPGCLSQRNVQGSSPRRLRTMTVVLLFLLPAIQTRLLSNLHLLSLPRREKKPPMKRTPAESPFRIPLHRNEKKRETKPTKGDSPCHRGLNNSTNLSFVEVREVQTRYLKRRRVEYLLLLLSSLLLSFRRQHSFHLSRILPLPSLLLLLVSHRHHQVSFLLLLLQHSRIPLKHRCLHSVHLLLLHFLLPRRLQERNLHQLLMQQLRGLERSQRGCRN